MVSCFLPGLRRLVLVMSFLILVAGGPVNARATTLREPGTSTSHDVIAAVNALRTANGLPPYKINGALMAAAQAHTEYQAEIGSWTHTGRGGSTPRSRAISAGYGGGATVYVSENVAMGRSMTAQDAVAIWQGDSIHLKTMLSPDYQDAGAGVASDGDSVYITLNVGYRAGSQPPEPPGRPTPDNPLQNTPGKPSPTLAINQPISTVTPLPDGSIVHVVQTGQVLITIAEAYHIDLADLLKLNNLTIKSIIFPGDRLLIRPVQATPTIMPTHTPPPPSPERLLSPTASIPRPTRSPTVVLEQVETASLLGDDINPDLGELPDRQGVDLLLIVIMGLVIGGIFLVVLGSLLKRRA